MLKLNFDKIQDTQNSANAWHNLTLSSHLKNSELVDASAMAWFRCNPDKRVIDLENQLRKENVNVFLLAGPKLDTEIDGQILKLKSINDSTQPLEYELNFKCLTRNDFNAHLTREGTDYNQNLEKLPNCGYYQLDDCSDFGDDNVVNKVNDNVIKLKLITLTQQQVNDEMNKDIEKAKIETGEESKAKPIGQAADGSVVLAHFVDNKVISQYGLMLSHDSSGKQVVKIILVSDKTTWV